MCQYPTRLRSSSGRRSSGRIGRGGAADDDVIAAAGAGVAAVEHEFFGSEPAEMGFFVERGGVVNQFIPVCGGLGVDFDDAGIGGDPDLVEAVIVRRSVAFDEDGKLEILGGVFDGGEQVEIIFEIPLRAA